MKENGIYDKKSLKSVVGNTADFNELAKDCVAFSNAEGGCIDIGIEDLKIYKIASAKEINQRIGEEIDSYKLWKQLKTLIAEGKIKKNGQNRWLKYELIE